MPLLFERFKGITAEMLENILSQRSYFREIYSSSRLILDVPKYTLYPSENYLNEAESELLFRINHRILTTEELIELEEDQHIKALCAVDTHLYQPLSKLFPGIREYHHVHYLLMDAGWSHVKGECLGIYLRNNTLTILVKRNQSVLLVNTYTIENEEELRYYTMLSAELTGIDALNSSMFIWPSDFNPSSKEWFEPYFQSVEYIPVPLQLSQYLNEDESKDFNTESILHAALSCES